MTLKNKIPENLFTLEMANNHMGDIEHGIHVIKSFGEICKKYPFSFAFKLQYRQLDAFIHPNMQGREDVPYIKRFSETRLTRDDFDVLVNEIRNQGFLTMSTPFDEESVTFLEKLKVPLYKVASFEITHLPLIKKIAKTRKPINESSELMSSSFPCKKVLIIVDIMPSLPLPIMTLLLSKSYF